MNVARRGAGEQGATNVVKVSGCGRCQLVIRSLRISEIVVVVFYIMTIPILVVRRVVS